MDPNLGMWTDHYYYRCIAHEILRHKLEHTSTVCISMAPKSLPPKIPGIGESHLKQWLRQWYNLKLVFLSSQYLECLGKPICAMLYAYCGVCSMLVPQNFMCHASGIVVNLSTYQSGVQQSKLERMCVNSFEPCSRHIILLVPTFLSVGTCTVVDVIIGTPSGTHMTTVIDIATFWNADLIFWISSKFVARWYIEWPCLRPVWPNPVVGLEYWTAIVTAIG